MRPPTYARSGAGALNMTPMIDVVFQLIVFFTATSTIAKTEYSHNVDLPIAEKGADRDPASDKKKITANVLATGDVLVAGRRVNARRFEQVLAAELDQHAAEHLEVEFRADSKARYAAVEPLLLACARRGVWQVSFAVKRPDQK